MARQKQKRVQYSADFKRQALERMKLAPSIVELARELGVARPLLYKWEAAAEGRGRSKGKRKQKELPEDQEANAREATLQQEVTWLREALARKVQEADFFKGALQKVEARRRNSGSGGATGSTTKSGK